MLPSNEAYPQSAYRKGGVFNLRLNTPVAKATSLFRKRNSEPLTAPSAERVKGDFASAEARRWTEPVWQLSDRPRHPFGSLTLLLGSNPTLAGRGGSVSRRDLNQAYREQPNSQAEPPMQKRTRQTPTALRERGSGGEALLSEKRPLPRSPLTPACSLLPFRRLGLGGTTRPRRERRSGGSIRPKPRRRAEASAPPDVPSAR